MKKLKVMLATALMFGAVSLPANALTGTAIYVNGQYLALDTMPVIAEDTTFVPLRAVSEALGANVDWVSNQAIVELDGKKITMQPGHKLAQVDGKALEMLAAPRLQGNRVLVPLRFVSEQMGAKVDYADHQIDIATEGAQTVTALAFEMCGEDEQYIYLNEGYDSKLTKIDKKTGERTYAQMADSTPLLILPGEDMIYYHKGEARADGGYDVYLCVGKMDGSEVTKMVLNGGTLRIYGEYLYYLVNNTQTFAHDLYRVKMVDGKPAGDGTLVKSYVQSYFFAGGQVYTVSDNGKMFKMNLDGSDQQECGKVKYDAGSLSFRCFSDGYFYYTGGGKLFRVTDFKSSLEIVFGFELAGLKADRIAVNGNKIYFNTMVSAEYMEGHWGTVTGPLWEMDLDGGNLRQLTEDKALEFYVLHYKIVYQTQNATGVEWKVIDK